MDTRAAMALIFRPGFSTQEEVSMDAGRGVGMDVVARSVYALGGKIGVSTHPGKFTRFKIVLPAASRQHRGRLSAEVVHHERQRQERSTASDPTS